MQIDNWFLKKGLSIRFYASEIIGCRRQRKGSIDPETIKKSLSRSNNLKTRTSKLFACSIVSQKKILVKTKLGHLFVMRLQQCLSHSEERGVNPCRFLIKFFLGVFLYA